MSPQDRYIKRVHITITDDNSVEVFSAAWTFSEQSATSTRSFIERGDGYRVSCFVYTDIQKKGA